MHFPPLGSVMAFCEDSVNQVSSYHVWNGPALNNQSRIWHWRSSIKAGPCSSSWPSCSAPLCDARPPLTPPPGPSATDMDWSLCLCVFLVMGLALLALLLKLRTPAHGPQEPPHLPALPLIGSLLSLRSPHPPHVLFKELQGKYGQTYSLMMGSHCVIVVNHHAHAKEVLLKKGKIFAGRPRSVGIPLLHLPLLLGSNSHSCFVPCPPRPVYDEGNHRCSDQRWERHRLWRLQCYLEIPQENSPWSPVHVWRGLCLHWEDQ